MGIKGLSIELWDIFNSIIKRIPLTMLRMSIYRMVSHIGNKSYIGLKVTMRSPRHIHIGNHTLINKNVLLDGRSCPIIIGDNVDIAQDSRIWTAEHDLHDDYHAGLAKPVIIEDYVWIASNVTILPGVHIHRGAVVATGSIVTKEVSEMAIVAGVPAKVIGTRKSRLKYELNNSSIFV